MKSTSIDGLDVPYIRPCNKSRVVPKDKGSFFHFIVTLKIIACTAFSS